jgi:hypothetical protein|tara:strand:- start:1367 stop:1753 length:387 start_codon:yes stop_codon:yes gene_type:complete
MTEKEKASLKLETLETNIHFILSGVLDVKHWFEAQHELHHNKEKFPHTAEYPTVAEELGGIADLIKQSKLSLQPSLKAGRKGDLDIQKKSIKQRCSDIPIVTTLVGLVLASAITWVVLNPSIVRALPW